MANSFRDLLQEIVNKSTEDKLKLAVHGYLDLLPKLKEFDKEHHGLGIVFCILGGTVAADGHLSEEEFAMVHGMLKASGAENITEDEVLKLIKTFSDDKSREIVKSVAHSLDEDGHASLVMLCASICAIDDTIKADEVKFLEDIL